MILCEENCGVAIALRIVSSQCLFEVCSRVRDFTLVEARVAQISISNRHFSRAAFSLGFLQEAFYGMPREAKFASHHAANPQAVIGWELFGRIADAGSKLVGAGERGFGFVSTEALSPD